MKVLFVSSFNGLDYQNDSIYFGLLENNLEVYETNYPYPLMKGYSNCEDLWGKGFTFGNKLTHSPNVESTEMIMDKIGSKFYDMIIYGSIWRNLNFIDHVVAHYHKNDVHLVDGEDSTKINNTLLSKGTYWKRELIDNKVNPIHFAIPVSQLIDYEPVKEKLFAHLIPGEVGRVNHTYIYNDEKSYYHDYAISHYGKTWKKGGWDCLRHYEILANKCIPHFPDIDSCPPNTMTTFPKEIIKETNKYAEKNEIHPSYNDINKELFEYTKNNLTTKKLVEKKFLQ